MALICIIRGGGHRGAAEKKMNIICYCSEYKVMYYNEETSKQLLS